jgi:hypothetical protein
MQSFPRKRAKHVARSAGAVALVCVTAYTIMWNIGKLEEPPFKFPQSLQFIGSALHIEQSWDMFSPSPPTTHWWYVINAETDTGEKFDLFKNAGLFNWKGTAPVSYDKPDSIHESFKNYRWYRYYESGYNPGHRTDIRLSFGRWICKSYNARHFKTERLFHFRVHLVKEDQNPDGDRDNQRTEELWAHVCYEKKEKTKDKEEEAEKEEKEEKDEKEEQEKEEKDKHAD